MYLVDTDVLNEIRKGARANLGVRAFFVDAERDDVTTYLSVVTLGELRRGVDLIHHRGDVEQANRLERWLQSVIDEYAEFILGFDPQTAQVWGRLRVPNPVVTGNARHFQTTGVRVLNPFS